MAVASNGDGDVLILRLGRLPMHNAKALIDLAEECFRQAEDQDDHLACEALRQKGLLHLEEAHEAWRARCLHSATGHARDGGQTSSSRGTAMEIAPG